MLGESFVKYNARETTTQQAQTHRHSMKKCVRICRDLWQIRLGVLSSPITERSDYNSSFIVSYLVAAFVRHAQDTLGTHWGHTRGTHGAHCKKWACAHSRICVHLLFLIVVFMRNNLQCAPCVPCVCLVRASCVSRVCLTVPFFPRAFCHCMLALSSWLHSYNALAAHTQHTPSTHGAHTEHTHSTL